MTIPQIPRGASHHQILFYARPKSRDLGTIHAVGLWTGGEDIDINVEGATRRYEGAGGILSVAPLQMRADLTVQSQSVVLSGISPDVDQLFRTYDARLAPAQIHVARFEPSTGELLGVDRVFDGQIDDAGFTISAIDDAGTAEATVTVNLVSRSRGLTRPLTGMRSDTTQRRRQGDRFFRFADVGLVEVEWTIGG